MNVVDMSRWCGSCAVALVLLVLLGVCAGAACASDGAWSVTSVASPSNVQSNDGTGNQAFIVTAVNTGAGATSGPVSLRDVLPAGVVARGVTGWYLPSHAELACSVGSVSCVSESVLQPGDELVMEVTVSVGALAEGTTVGNKVSVSGGGAAPVTAVRKSLVSSKRPSFGIAQGSVLSSVSSLRAGAHPNFTTGFMFDTEALNTVARRVRDVSIALPPGLTGYPAVAGQCTMAAVEIDKCPSNTAVGAAMVLLVEGEEMVPTSTLVYNITPYPDEPAAFAFDVAHVPVRLDMSIHPNPDVSGGYEIRVTAGRISEDAEILGTTITLWGVPVDHNGPGEAGHVTAETSQSFGGRGSGPRLPFISNATQCSQSLSVGITADSWQEPGPVTIEGLPNLTDSRWSTASPALGIPSNCAALRFEPTLSFKPDTPLAGSPPGYQAAEPAGYRTEIHIPQNQAPEAIATSDLRDAVMTLPEGVALSPSAAYGLVACSEEQIAPGDSFAPTCPEAAKVGVVEIMTPLLSQALRGSVYLAQQNANPFGSLFALYVVAEGSGVVVKLAGEVQADPVTGQLTTTFKDTPQIPFSDLKLTLGGGPGAPLANPTQCGPATTTALLTPYAGAPASPSSSYNVVGCSTRFAPSFAAGMANKEAGSFSPLSVTFSRTDQDGDFLGAQVTMPPGVLGNIKSVELCPEAQANALACPSGSEVGQATVGSGPGSNPFFLHGRVYITGPYHGAPYGLLITVPAVVGPFDLGVVPVRATMSIDSRTAQLTLTSDAFPTILDGIPLHVKTVNVTVARPGFTFNATNCEPMQAIGKLVSTTGVVASVSSPYQVAGCQALGFSPKMTVKTNGHVGRKGSASLTFHLSYPMDSEGTQANVRSFAATLPKQLPARLTTIQQACIDTTFNVNPSACPPQSLIGVAIVSTPALNGRLSGPVYLVSHGGAAFPGIDIVIQGDGLRVDLTGAISIVKNITSVRFDAIPDVPITGFELILPEGPHSGLAAVSNLCTTLLNMPIAVFAQNGDQFKQKLRVNPYSCPTRKRKRKKRR